MSFSLEMCFNSMLDIQPADNHFSYPSNAVHRGLCGAGQSFSLTSTFYDSLSGENVLE